MNLPRSSGILLHVTSLPGGRLGTAAYGFVDWLAAAGQSWWQVLPLGPPDRSGSPYTSSSAFAGWPGLLAEPGRGRERRARSRRSGPPMPSGSPIGSASPARAPSPTRCASSASGATLRRYAAARGVRLIGDIPLYVGARSADHRAHPGIFQRGFVAGAPPDALERDRTAVGQPALRLARAARAGLPLVDRAPAARVRSCADLARIDHFRGFVAYWSVPARARTRARGPLAARARARGVRRRAARARRAAADRGGPRRDHAARRAAAAGARPARHGRAAVRLRRRPAQPAPAREPRASCWSSTPARTTPRRPSAGGTRSARARARAPASIPPSRTGR